MDPPPWNRYLLHRLMTFVTGPILRQGGADADRWCPIRNPIHEVRHDAGCQLPFLQPSPPLMIFSIFPRHLPPPQFRILKEDSAQNPSTPVPAVHRLRTTTSWIKPSLPPLKGQGENILNGIPAARLPLAL